MCATCLVWALASALATALALGFGPSPCQYSILAARPDLASVVEGAALNPRLCIVRPVVIRLPRPCQCSNLAAQPDLASGSGSYTLSSGLSQLAGSGSV